MTVQATGNSGNVENPWFNNNDIKKRLLEDPEKMQYLGGVGFAGNLSFAETIRAAFSNTSTPTNCAEGL